MIKKKALADAMVTLRQDGRLKLLQGLTDIHEIRRVCIKQAYRRSKAREKVRGPFKGENR